MHNSLALTLDDQSGWGTCWRAEATMGSTTPQTLLPSPRQWQGMAEAFSSCNNCTRKSPYKAELLPIFHGSSQSSGTYINDRCKFFNTISLVRSTRPLIQMIHSSQEKRRKKYLGIAFQNNSHVMLHTSQERDAALNFMSAPALL